MERWLKAPLQQEDGTLVQQGSRYAARLIDLAVVSQPLLALRVRHVDGREFPHLQFERYCDDVVVHCESERQAQFVREAIAQRLAECGLELHPDKTRIVYCKDADRRATYANERFDFLGYTFRPRWRGEGWREVFVNFLPAVSDDAMKAMGREATELAAQLRSDKSLGDLARMSTKVQGWINYYGRFYRSGLYPDLPDASTSISCDGPSGSTSGCAPRHGGRKLVLAASPTASRRCLLIGDWGAARRLG